MAEEKLNQSEEPLYEELSALEQAMASEEHETEGSFVTGGAAIGNSLFDEEEKATPDEVIENPPEVKDGPELLAFLRDHLSEFASPYAYLGGEANSPDRARFKTAKLKILIARPSTYEAVSLSMTHSLMAQIYQELPWSFCDITFLPRPGDLKLLRKNGFPLWFGTNTKLAPKRFDVLSITHAVSMEQLNFVPCLYESGIPLFKDQRMEREDIPLVIVGGMNSGTTAPLAGAWKEHAYLFDAVVYGDGEQSAKILMATILEGKEKGLTKKEILRSCHGRVPGFYEPDCYEHTFDGKGRITKITRKPEFAYAEFPVARATVPDLNDVRTMEAKILPYSGDGSSVDVAISGQVGCIGSAGLGACSFCREGSEGPWRERSLNNVMDALGKATRNQGTKEVSYFSLNFNMYKDFFPLVQESVKKGYKVGLISQRVDMLAETPEQIRVQRWLKKANFTLGVEGISQRMRNYLNKNLTEEQLIKTCTVFMEEGATELKLFEIATGLETEEDAHEFCAFVDKIEKIKKDGGYKTNFRISFTPLFPSAFTALQFAPAFAAINNDKKSLNPIFTKAREVGWGRRLSVSGEEPLISNTINHGGRNILPLLMDSYFKDGFVFYGNVPKGTWDRWKPRIQADPNIDPDIMWGEKDFEYIFPWEDIAYATSKKTLYEGYKKAKAFINIPYCISTRTIRGECHWTECGCCDTAKVGKPNFNIIQNIVNRKIAPIITSETVAETAKSREKAVHLRVLFDIKDPIYRFVSKKYFEQAIPRALMLVSDEFNEAFSSSLGNVRTAAGSKGLLDWTFGKNIYDFALVDNMSETYVKSLAEMANRILKEGQIIDMRCDKHLTVLRNEIDYVIYSILIPSKELGYGKIREVVKNYFERQELGKIDTIKVRVPKGKGAFKTEERFVGTGEVRQVQCSWEPDQRGTMFRAVVSAKYNPFSLLESITGRRSHTWKDFPIYCDGYVQSPEDSGEVDIFSALSGTADRCSECEGVLETDIFTGEPLRSGVCLACDMDQLVIDPKVFFVEEMEAVCA